MPDNTAPDRNEIRATLRRHGVPQKAIAEVLEVHESTISLWLKGEVSSPKLDAGVVAYVAGLEAGIERKSTAA